MDTLRIEDPDQDVVMTTTRRLIFCQIVKENTTVEKSLT